MYAELYQYLILHNQLPVPGIGTFLLERKPAQSDFLNKQINPPLYSISLQPHTGAASKNFFAWLGNALGITERDAVIRFNDFVFDMKRQISSGASIEWNGIGTLSKGLAEEIRFTDPAMLTVEPPVKAEKVIREKAEHIIRVGEEEKTSTEMTALLNKEAVRKSYWWVYALAITVFTLMFIGWYLSENGVDISSSSNTQKLAPMEAGNPYSIIQ